MSVDSTDPINQLITLLENPRVRSFFDNLINIAVEKKIKESYETADFKNAVENILLTSEIKPIKRIAELEQVTGLEDFEDEEHEPTIPEQISALSKKIGSLGSRPASMTYREPECIIPETKTEARAVFLVEYLEKEVNERNGELFLNGNEIKDFFTRIIPEKYNPECTVKKGQNIRKIKKDVLEKAAKLFPGNIFINKNKNGRKETRVLFRPYPTVPM